MGIGLGTDAPFTPGQRVRMRKTRWDDRDSGSWPMEVVALDGDGIWLTSPRYTVHTNRDSTFGYIAPHAWLLLVKPGRRWVVNFTAWDNKIDLCEPIVVVDRSNVDFCDLELDVVWSWGGSPSIVDWEEFRGLGLAPDHHARVELEAEDLRCAIVRGEEPFGSVARARLEAVGGAPLDAAPQGSWLSTAWPWAIEPLAAIFGDDVVRAGWKNQLAGNGALVCGGVLNEFHALAWVDRGPVRARDRVSLLGVTPAGSPSGMDEMVTTAAHHVARLWDDADRD